VPHSYDRSASFIRGRYGTEYLSVLHLIQTVKPNCYCCLLLLGSLRYLFVLREQHMYSLLCYFSAGQKVRVLDDGTWYSRERPWYTH
jgi:hypothetical protein